MQHLSSSEVAALRERLSGALARASAHGYNQVGAPSRRHGTIVLAFRKGDDEIELAEGELAFWLDGLDAEVASGIDRIALALGMARVPERAGRYIIAHPHQTPSVTAEVLGLSPTTARNYIARVRRAGLI